MFSNKTWKFVALSFSILVSFVLIDSVKSAYADSTREEILKQEQVAEQQAEAYLNQFGQSSGYGQFNAASTNEFGGNRTAQLAQAEYVTEQKANQYLGTIATPSHMEIGAASTNEFGADRNAQLADARQTLEKMTQNYVKMQESNYGWFNATTTDEQATDRNSQISQERSAVIQKVEPYLQQTNNSEYTQIKSTGTDLSGLVNRTAEIVQAEQTVEQQAQTYLQHITKPYSNNSTSVSTDESGNTRNDEITQARLALELKDKELIAQMYPKLSKPEYSGS